MLTDSLKKLFTKNPFLVIATSSLEGKPNAAPMFVIKADDTIIYVVDYTMGTTYRNLKANPIASVSAADYETLKGFKLNGQVEMFREGKLYEEIREELKRKTFKLSTDRVIEGIRQKKKHKDFEIEMLENFIVYQITIKELIEIGPRGSIKKHEI